MDASLWRIVIAMTLLNLFCAGQLCAERLHAEKEYQKAWCQRAGGRTEVVLADRTRVDCLTREYAIEFDFASKWAESIGQALYYSIQTGKKSGVVLILEKSSDYKYWVRLNTVIERSSLPVKTWIMAPKDL